MVVAHQVQNAVKDEDAHFLVEGATEPERVAAGNGGAMAMSPRYEDVEEFEDTDEAEDKPLARLRLADC